MSYVNLRLVSFCVILCHFMSYVIVCHCMSFCVILCHFMLLYVMYHFVSLYVICHFMSFYPSFLSSHSFSADRRHSD